MYGKVSDRAVHYWKDVVGTYRYRRLLVKGLNADSGISCMLQSCSSLIMVNAVKTIRRKSVYMSLQNTKLGKVRELVSLKHCDRIVSDVAVK